MQHIERQQPPEPTALQAREAGVLLASLIGLPEPIAPQRMWRMARLGQVPSLKLGRMVFFRDDVLRRFAARAERFEP